MSDLGLLHHFLGLEVTQEDDEVFVSRQSYAEAMLRKFNMFGCKAVPTPLASNEKLMKNDGGRKVDSTLYRSIIGSLMYLTATRPDIMFATSLLSRFMQIPNYIYLGAAKRVLRYIKGTLAYRIKYFKGEELTLIGFCDSDWAGSKDYMKSTSGFVFSLGYTTSAASWYILRIASTEASTASCALLLHHSHVLLRWHRIRVKLSNSHRPSL
uniref:Uncharacterized mitochondrial protein AtMg00810-like n=1 Tax=Nicotiana tabacum TaxID=4097 RepID=A0A1S4BUH7_TOBAC|nr:PREDICTED: uncharacterized mitochondrial protein AtMg00810-like [Nicotiana tabacum]